MISGSWCWGVGSGRRQTSGAGRSLVLPVLDVVALPMLNLVLPVPVCVASTSSSIART